MKTFCIFWFSTHNQLCHGFYFSIENHSDGFLEIFKPVILTGKILSFLDEIMFFCKVTLIRFYLILWHL